MPTKWVLNPSLRIRDGRCSQSSGRRASSLGLLYTLFSAPSNIRICTSPIVSKRSRMPPGEHRGAARSTHRGCIHSAQVYPVPRHCVLIFYGETYGSLGDEAQRDISRPSRGYTCMANPIRRPSRGRPRLCVEHISPADVGQKRRPRIPRPQV